MYPTFGGPPQSVDYTTGMGSMRSAVVNAMARQNVNMPVMDRMRRNPKPKPGGGVIPNLYPRPKKPGMPGGGYADLMPVNPDLNRGDGIDPMYEIQPYMPGRGALPPINRPIPGVIEDLVGNGGDMLGGMVETAGDVPRFAPMIGQRPMRPDALGLNDQMRQLKMQVNEGGSAIDPNVMAVLQWVAAQRRRGMGPRRR